MATCAPCTWQCTLSVLTALRRYHISRLSAHAHRAHTFYTPPFPHRNVNSPLYFVRAMIYSASEVCWTVEECLCLIISLRLPFVSSRGDGQIIIGFWLLLKAVLISASIITVPVFFISNYKWVKWSCRLLNYVVLRKTVQNERKDFGE